jgi:hypothetical protein
MLEVLAFASALAGFGYGFPAMWNWLDALEAQASAQES